MRGTYSLLAEFQFGSKSAQVLEKVVVWPYFDAFTKVFPDAIVYLARVDEEQRLVLSDDRICEENRIEIDVRATEVEEPGNLVEHVDHHGLVVLPLEVLLETFDLLRMRLA